MFPATDRKNKENEAERLLKINPSIHQVATKPTSLPDDSTTWYPKIKMEQGRSQEQELSGRTAGQKESREWGIRRHVLTYDSCPIAAEVVVGGDSGQAQGSHQCREERSRSLIPRSCSRPPTSKDRSPGSFSAGRAQQQYSSIIRSVGYFFLSFRPVDVPAAATQLAGSTSNRERAGRTVSFFNLLLITASLQKKNKHVESGMDILRFDSTGAGRGVHDDGTC